MNCRPTFLKLQREFLLWVVSLMFALSVNAAPLTFYVATDGSDSNPGTIDQPFATLDAARDAIRVATGRTTQAWTATPEDWEGATVYVRSGNYDRTTSLDFDARDSGTIALPVVWSAYPEESVTVSGLLQVGESSWEAATDPLLVSRIPVAVRAVVRVLNLSRLGLKSRGTFPPEIPEEALTAAAPLPLTPLSLRTATGILPSVSSLGDLTQPGESWIDGATGTIVRYPESTEPALFAVAATVLLRMQSVQNLLFARMSFRMCRGTAVEVQDSRNIILRRTPVTEAGCEAIVSRNSELRIENLSGDGIGGPVVRVIASQDLAAEESLQPETVISHTEGSNFGVRMAAKPAEVVSVQNGIVGRDEPDLPTDFFPLGAYDKFGKDSEGYGTEFTHDQWIAYYRNVFQLLHANNMNTLATGPIKDPQLELELLNEASDAGIKIIRTVIDSLNAQWDYAGPGRAYSDVYSHPAILAYKYLDEPTDERTIAIIEEHCRQIRKYYTKPCVTAFFGEGIDSEATFQKKAWRDIGTEVKFVREYPYRKTFDLVDWETAKMAQAPADMFAEVERLHSWRSWWYIPQFMGQFLPVAPGSYWRFPTAAEFNALLHLSLAHGARGIVGYSLQQENNWFALVSQDLQPMVARDGSKPLDSAKTFGELLMRETPFFLCHRPGGFFASSDSRSLEVMAREDPISGVRYAYFVNLDCENEVTTTATLAPGYHVLRIDDIFRGGSVTSVDDVSGIRIVLDLNPGEGRLLRFVPDPF